MQYRDEESSSRHVPFIALLSDGEESEGSSNTQWEQVIKAGSNHPLREVLGRYPVHTFVFGNFHDPMALLAVARVSFFIPLGALPEFHYRDNEITASES